MKDAWKLSATASHPKRKNHVRLFDGAGDPDTAQNFYSSLSKWAQPIIRPVGGVNADKTADFGIVKRDVKLHGSTDATPPPPQPVSSRQYVPRYCGGDDSLTGLFLRR